MYKYVWNEYEDIIKKYEDLTLGIRFLENNKLKAAKRVFLSMTECKYLEKRLCIYRLLGIIHFLSLEYFESIYYIKKGLEESNGNDYLYFLECLFFVERYGRIFGITPRIIVDDKRFIDRYKNFDDFTIKYSKSNNDNSINSEINMTGTFLHSRKKNSNTKDIKKYPEVANIIKKPLKSIEKTIKDGKNDIKSTFSNNITDPVSISNNITEPINISNNITDPVNISNNITEPVNISNNITEPINISNNITDPINISNNTADLEKIFENKYMLNKLLKNDFYFQIKFCKNFYNRDIFLEKLNRVRNEYKGYSIFCVYLYEERVYIYDMKEIRLIDIDWKEVSEELESIMNENRKVLKSEVKGEDGKRRWWMKRYELDKRIGILVGKVAGKFNVESENRIICVFDENTIGFPFEKVFRKITYRITSLEALFNKIKENEMNKSKIPTSVDKDNDIEYDTLDNLKKNREMIKNNDFDIIKCDNSIVNKILVSKTQTKYINLIKSYSIIESNDNHYSKKKNLINSNDNLNNSRYIESFNNNTTVNDYEKTKIIKLTESPNVKNNNQCKYRGQSLKKNISDLISESRFTNDTINKIDINVVENTRVNDSEILKTNELKEKSIVFENTRVNDSEILKTNELKEKSIVFENTRVGDSEILKTNELKENNVFETKKTTKMGKNINSIKIFYLLDAENNLISTQKCISLFIEEHLKNRNIYGVCGRFLNPQELKQLSMYELFMFFGHGSGRKYFNLQNLLPYILFLFGCSSCKLLSVKNFKYNGHLLSHLNKGRSILGTLWEVTDKDLDRFTVHFLKDFFEGVEIGQALLNNFDIFKMKYLNGAAIVIYGIPQEDLIS